MSSVNAPFGLRPSFHPSGTIRPTAGTITTGYASNIYMGSPVGFIADGSIALAAAGGTAVAGACGCFQGCEYTPSNGRRTVSNIWPASTVATEIVAYFTLDPTIVYDIQGNAAIAQTAIGQQFDWSTNGSANGNLITGFSSVTLDTASSAANAGLRVIGLTPGPDNAWGDAFTIVQVQLSEHQFVATIAAI
jgi:hypothetical protein